MKTKFGTVNYDGRYCRISSRKEGNRDKMLHRLIFEDFYQIKLPSNIIIHHDDGNTRNNEIWNLIPMTNSEHNTLHHKGMEMPEEEKVKISNSMKGEKNHFYGKHHSKKTREYLSNLHKGKPGFKHTNDAKRRISLNKNTTGYRNVSIQKTPSCKQGFIYRYNYSENGKQKAIYSVDINKLKEKVLAKGLGWEEFAEVI